MIEKTKSETISRTAIEDSGGARRKYLKEREVNEAYNITLAKLQNDRWNRVGLPYIKIGRLVYYDRDDVEAYFQSHKILPAVVSTQV